MFQSARLKLTAYYLIIIMVISVSVSLLFYQRATRILEIEYARVEQRLMKQWHISQGLPPEARLILHNDLIQAKRLAALNLMTINSVILLMVGALSYFLAGKTLEPIKTAMEEQRRFVGDAAHELKTPLTALKTSLEVNLMDESFTKKMQQVLKENLEDVSNLSLLTESLLKLANVADKKLELKPISLKATILLSMKQLKPLANNKNQEIILTTNKKKLLVMGDRGALMDLFLIILDNAIKYSPKASKITIEVDATRKNGVVKITDQGIGIPSDQLTKIFDRFYRVDQSRNNSSHTGYGLGLSIAKKIVSQHEGSIKFLSQVGHGTTAIIKIPLA